MKFTRTGLILFTERYADCVAFYGNVLGLPVVFAEDYEDGRLTCFDFGGSYLMVETDGVASDKRKGVAQSPVKLRFNVYDVEATVAELRAKGVAVRVVVHPWGTTAEFEDPDGNPCALRSEDGQHKGVTDA